ncbi:leucine-rich repeat domain-containing protein [Kordia sp.]|uniref:leucine-rich repeat domain-containing protein n=1 Tax=Kordia sp. TaxID=1965332 RepID=UPI003D6A7E4A
MGLKLLFVFLTVTNILCAASEVVPLSNDNFTNTLPLINEDSDTSNTVEASTDEVNVPDTPELAIPITPLPEGTGCQNDNLIELDFGISGITDSGLGGCRFTGSGTLDLFFTWTATTDGLKFERFGSNEAVGVIVRNAMAPYDIIDCTSLGSGNSSDIIFTGWEVGDNLIIQVNRTRFPSGGTMISRFCLEEKTIIPPPNDTAAGAIPITPSAVGSDCSITSNNLTVLFDTDTYTTTDSGLDSSCRGENTGADQFFTWTATSTGLLFGPNTDLVGITIRSTSGVEYVCAVRSYGDSVRLSGWQLGEELIIQIHLYKYTHHDSRTFCLQEFNTPENDLITGAIPIVPDDFGEYCIERTLPFSTDGTTDSGLDGTCNAGNTGYDQFFTWTATTDALIWTTLGGNPGIIIRNAVGNEIICTNAIGVTPEDTVLSGWEVGDELIIQIYSWVFQTSIEPYPLDLTPARDVSFCLQEYMLIVPPGQTFVPDNNFEQALIDLGYDDVLDNYVLTANINTLTSLNIANKNIVKLKGIEDFTALQQLDFSDNMVTVLDVSQNAQLTTLVFPNNALRELDVSQNPLLTTILAEGNSLWRIDVIQNPLLENLNVANNSFNSLILTQNLALTIVNAANNSLRRIDVTQNIALTSLTVNENSITTLDVTNNPSLSYVSAADNELTSVDITQNPLLSAAYFGNNQLNSIDVSQNPTLQTLNIDGNSQISTINVTVNTALEVLNISNTQISEVAISDNINLKSLSLANCPIAGIDVTDNVLLETLHAEGSSLFNIDVSQNPDLVNLSCNDSDMLNSINIQNGNNANVLTFNTTNTPSLSCVQVDDAAYSTAYWNNVDLGTNFTTDCNFPENDNCVDAIAVPISTVLCENAVAGTLALSTNSNTFQCFGDSGSFSDVWFSFVATETTHNIKILNSSGINSGIYITVIDGQTYNCGNITDAIYCSTSNALEDEVTGFTIGNTYYLQVYTDIAASTETFDVCVATTTTPGLTYVPDDNFEQALIDLNFDDVLDDYVATANINTVTNLNIRNLGISDLTGIEDFAALEILDCGVNLLSVLDLSNNSNLNDVAADNNMLTSFNIKNGNNTNIIAFTTLGNLDLSCIQVDIAVYSTTNWPNIEPTTSFSELCNTSVQIAAKVYLQGAMLQSTNGFMRADLKDNNYIDTAASPYGDGVSISYEAFTAVGNDKIVDWIWIELRDATNPTTIIDGKSAILQSDGDIVDAAANNVSTPISFSQDAGDYYIVIKHRNHFGIMSNSTFALSDTVTAVDFTNSNNPITYGTHAQTTFGMPENTLGMWCGDVNGDHLIQYSGNSADTPAILSKVLNDPGNFLNFPTYRVLGYDAHDINMDGHTQYSGTNPDAPFLLQNALAHPGNFLNFPTFQIIEQLPEHE